MNLIHGKVADSNAARRFLDELKDAVERTLKSGALEASAVIDAADRLSQALNLETALPLLSSFGISARSAEHMVSEAKKFLSRGYLKTKLVRELGEVPFSDKIMDGSRVSFRPLGVITHISAGNAAGLPAFSVLEGLLTGNINILKLPGSDDGLSTILLKMLIESEPRLADYIYVFDLPSTDADSIRKMLSVSDAVCVWGSDFAVTGIRTLAPPSLRLIEWGHRLSFACVTKKGETPEVLDEIAKDICESEQLLCSSPQCVYYESANFDELEAFGQRLFSALKKKNSGIPATLPDSSSQAEITSLLLLKSQEELLDNKRVMRGEGFSVIVDGDPELVSSPMYRNVWVKPMGNMFETLRGKKGYLQTAGLSCAQDEYQRLSELLFKAGVCRITRCGEMSGGFPGEPHDGRYALRQYVKTVVMS